MTAGLRGLFSEDQLLERAARAITRVLATDSLATARLRELTGRVIAIQIKGFETTIFAAVNDSELLFATSTAREPDVMLAGKLADFAAFAEARGSLEVMPAGKLQIQGDLATAQAVQRLLDELAIDWEALLATRLGDVAAHQIGRGVRRGLAWFKEARAAWVEDIPTYLQQERQWVPSAEQVEGFTRDSMTLGADVERLAARIARLRARRTSAPTD